MNKTDIDHDKIIEQLTIENLVLKRELIKLQMEILSRNYSDISDKIDELSPTQEPENETQS